MKSFLGTDKAMMDGRRGRLPIFVNRDLAMSHTDIRIRLYVVLEAAQETKPDLRFNRSTRDVIKFARSGLSIFE